MRAPNVYTISPAQPFLATVVERFLAGDLGVGSAPAGDPLALAATRIYVPTQRAGRALAAEFRTRATGPSVVLPRILPLGALEATEAELLFTEPDPASGLPLPPAASSIWRRLRLAELIGRWAEAIGGALRLVGADGTAVVDAAEAFRVATSPADAFALAGDLARLIDEMTIEDVAWRSLDELHMAGFDDYWRITTTFLEIAVTAWPQMLEDRGLVDRAMRQKMLVDAQAGDLTAGRDPGPVLAIGSTGTNRATARLLAAIARAPCGAVVLPGLDRDLDAVAWRLVSGALEVGDEPSFGHPQAAMARLLPVLGLDRGGVLPLGRSPASAATIRERFVAEALRPADTTEVWRGWKKGVPAADLAQALADVTLVEATDEREEALALAVALREVLETPGRTAALVTPDRDLARRVRGELLRWNVEVTDTAGEPFAGRPLGVFARLVAAAAATGSAGDLGALLAHPLTAPGRPRSDVVRLAAKLEVAVLRTVPLAGRSSSELFAAAHAAASDRHAHPAQKSLRDEDWSAMGELWAALEAALAPLVALRRGSHTLAAWAEAHRAAVAAVAGDGAVAADEADALETLLDELAPETGTLRFDAEGYGLLFSRLAGEVALRNTDHPHPRLQILGLIEARLIAADVMVLGGLDETIWPPAAPTDAFLNRPMRHELGLTPPERRIGQTAHDFTMAMGTGTVVLSRAGKRGGSPTVASRFLLRLEALGGKAWQPVRERGARLLKLARNLDRPLTDPVPARRPNPKPPLALRPTQLSVTAIETLRRDPYSVHAQRILRLQRLPEVEDELGAGDYGSLMHAALHAFVGDAAAGGTAATRRTVLERIVRETFHEALADPVFLTFRWPVMLKTIDLFLAFDAAQRDRGGTIEVETDGALAFVLADTSEFTLTARADRLERHDDGTATLSDYKTGQPPGAKEVQVGFAPQLTLEAAILREGGFGAVPPGETGATYVKLGGKDGGFVRPLRFDDGESFAACVDRHFAGLKQLLSSFREEKTGYPSRPFPKYARPDGPYDHLARVSEWSLAGDEEGAP